jgi:hypothetical protein
MRYFQKSRKSSMDSISKQYFGHYFEICISYRLVEKKDSVLEKNIESLDIQN